MKFDLRISSDGKELTVVHNGSPLEGVTSMEVIATGDRYKMALISSPPEEGKEAPERGGPLTGRYA